MSSSNHSIVRFARRSAAKCRRRISKMLQMAPTDRDTVLDQDILELALSKIDLQSRLRLGMIHSTINKLVHNMPMFLNRMEVSSSGKHFEMRCDQMDVITEYILDGSTDSTIKIEEALAFDRKTVSLIFRSIASKVSGINELWLSSDDNCRILRPILDYISEVNERENRSKRFKIEHLTIVGSTTEEEMDTIISFLRLCRRHIISLRLRLCKLHTLSQSQALWSVIEQCPTLQQLQYEPCRLDRFSRVALVTSMENKKLTSLILTGIHELSSTDILTMTRPSAESGDLKELAIVGANITPLLYSDPRAKTVISNLSTLLLQIEESFSLQDAELRSSLLHILCHLPETSILEIIHVTRENSTGVTRIISYWMNLARHSGRCIHLKLEDCSQQRQDEAVGKLFRKCGEVMRRHWSRRGISMSLGDGSLMLLNKKTWFGDE